jgi:predicted RNA-binding Zn ribbon-like protein
MSRDPLRAATQFFGGRVCLDFANTMDWRTSDKPQELIADYAGLLAWSRRRHTVTARCVTNLQILSMRTPGDAENVQNIAHALRSDIWVIAEALCRRDAAPLTAINHLLAELPAQPPLVRTGSEYVYDLPGARLDELLWPILWSLTALLSSNDAGRLACCEGHGCGWFFVDESPNRSRVWCSNNTCGNRERARRAYSKRRSKAPA